MRLLVCDVTITHSFASLGIFDQLQKQRIFAKVLGMPYELLKKSRDRLTNPNLEFTLFTDRSLSFNTATRLLLLDLQALAALERA